MLPIHRVPFANGSVQFTESCLKPRNRNNRHYTTLHWVIRFPLRINVPRPSNVYPRPKTRIPSVLPFGKDITGSETEKMGDHSSEGTDYTSGLRFPMCVYCPRNWILNHSLPAMQRPNTLLPVRHSIMWRVSRGHIVLRNQTTLIPHCLLYTSPSPRDLSTSRMPSSA